MKIFSRIYGSLIRNADKLVPKILQPLWLSPVGPRTVFFWGPVMKWCVVLAGLGDVFTRPAHLISMRQSCTLAVTGALWSRWSYVIKPRNYNFMACNMAMSVSQCVLLWRSLDASKEWQNWRKS